MEIKVDIFADDRGMIGRECPECKQYFKIKPGTGLPISECSCPYCQFRSSSNNFFTPEQVEYIKSVVINRVIASSLKKLNDSFKELERKTRRSLVSFKVKNIFEELPINYYAERDLETLVCCNSCGLEFSVYGVFASCPDCDELNAIAILKKSLETARKRLALIKNIHNDDGLQEALVVDSLNSSIACFDGFGKQLRINFADVFPEKPKNLFQNLFVLSESLHSIFKKKINDLVGEDNYFSLIYMFQLRHIWIHNSGVVDDEFIRKTKSKDTQLGRKLVPEKEEIEKLIDIIGELSERIYLLLKDYQCK